MDNSIKTILLVGFALLALAAAASGLPTVSVTNNTEWLTAGGGETATVTGRWTEAWRVRTFSSRPVTQRWARLCRARCPDRWNGDL
jgi:hypothetical protein